MRFHLYFSQFSSKLLVWGSLWRWKGGCWVCWLCLWSFHTEHLSITVIWGNVYGHVSGIKTRTKNIQLVFFFNWYTGVVSPRVPVKLFESLFHHKTPVEAHTSLCTRKEYLMLTIKLFPLFEDYCRVMHNVLNSNRTSKLCSAQVAGINTSALNKQNKKILNFIFLKKTC